MSVEIQVLMFFCFTFPNATDIMEACYQMNLTNGFNGF